MDTKSMIIGALALAVIVLGVLYYQETQEPSVKIDLPGVKIEGQ